MNGILDKIDLSWPADDMKFYCGSWPLTLGQSLSVSVAIIVPSKKLFIQNLQLRGPRRENSCLWCCFRCQDRHSWLGKSWGSLLCCQPQELTLLEGCFCTMTFI